MPGEECIRYSGKTPRLYGKAIMVRQPFHVCCNWSKCAMHKLAENANSRHFTIDFQETKMSRTISYTVTRSLQSRNYQEKEPESSSSSDSDSDDDLDIHEIVRQGNLAEIKEAISRDRPKYIALKDKFGKTALHYAVETNNERAALFLIAKAANINAKDDKERTPLHHAAAKGFIDMCRFLLDFNANIKAKDAHCWTPLHHAVDGNHMETATLLIKRGVDIHAEDHRYGRTCLHLAAERGFAKMSEMLIIRGADLCATGDAFFSKTPLHISCLHGHSEVTEVLIRKGADVNTLSGLLDKGPLHFAAEEGHLDCLQQLLRAGADPNRHGNHSNGYTPLHLAVVRNHWHIAGALLEGEQQFNVNVNLPGKFSVDGCTALHLACQHGHTHIVQLLVDTCTVNREAQDANHRTPLHIACKYGHYGIADLMMEFSGCNYKAKALDGKTPIDLISDPVEKDRLKLLCYKLDLVKKYEEEQARRRKEIEDQRRAEAEAVAAMKAQEEAERMRAIAARTANWRKQLTLVCDVAGEIETFQQLAAEYLDQDINCLLIEVKADDDKLQSMVVKKEIRSAGHDTGVIPPITQATALTRAAYRGFYDLVQALLHWQKIDIDFQETETGNTALHYAADHGFRDIVELLLLHGAKNYLLNKKGQVPANLARTSALREIIRNVRLIAKRHLFQDAVLVEIYHRQSLLQIEKQSELDPKQKGNSSENDGNHETKNSEMTLGLVVFEENLSHPETLRHIMDATTPMKSNAPGESSHEYSEINQLLSSPAKSSSSRLEKEKTSVKLPPLSVGGLRSVSSPSPLQHHLKQRSQQNSHDSFTSPNKSSSTIEPMYFPSMGPQNGALYSPNFQYPSATNHGPSNATVFSTATGDNQSIYSRQSLELEQQKAHVPFAQRIYKDRQGYIEAVSGMNDGQSTLPPVRGPMTIHDFDNHAMDDLYSVHSFAVSQNIKRDMKEDSEQQKDLAVVDFIEVNLASFLAHHYDAQQLRPTTSKAAKRLQEKLQTKYGMIPITFGGCRRDLFFVQLRANKYHQPKIPLFKDQEYSTVYHLQRSYLPTSFDTTEEYIEVRDFLWLLGQPYHVMLIEERKNNLPLQASNDVVPQLLLSACFKGFDADTAAKRDKRSFLYDIAVAMNLLHDLFTTPTSTGQQQTSSLAPTSTSTPASAYLLHQAIQHKLVQNSTNSNDNYRPFQSHVSVSQKTTLETISLPKNLLVEDLDHLHHFAAICRDFLTIVLTVYDTNFPAYLEGCVATHHDTYPATTDPTTKSTLFTSSSSPVKPKQDQTAPLWLNITQERLVIQALRDEIFYLQQYGYLDETLVNLLYSELLPCCTLYALDFLLGNEQSMYVPTHSTTAKSSSKSKKLAKKLSFDTVNTEVNTADFKEDENESLLKRDPLKSTWATMLLNPPRGRRQAMDIIYELTMFLMQQAEVSYPTDAIRAHLWAQQARQLLREYRQKSNIPVSAMKEKKNAEENDKENQSYSIDNASSIAGEFVMKEPSSFEIAATALQLWLEDLALLEYEKYFVGLGFKLLEDFQELNEEDCYRYFPFIKVGDMRRLAKRCDQLTDSIVQTYLNKAKKVHLQMSKQQKQKNSGQLNNTSSVQSTVNKVSHVQSIEEDYGDEISLFNQSQLQDDHSSILLSGRLPSVHTSPRATVHTVNAEEEEYMMHHNIVMRDASMEEIH